MKRSSCASGRGYVPSYSMGFCVAMIMKGGGMRCATLSMVAWPSSMHSSRLACVFGEARLISSASTTLANTGPAWNSKRMFCWSNTLTPVTSLGSRSGVNWMREKRPPTERASDLASSVFPLRDSPR